MEISARAIAIYVSRWRTALRITIDTKIIKDTVFNEIQKDSGDMCPVFAEDMAEKVVKTLLRLRRSEMKKVRIRFTDGDWEEWDSEIAPKVEDSYVMIGTGSATIMIPMRCIKFLESEEVCNEKGEDV